MAQSRASSPACC